MSRATELLQPWVGLVAGVLAGAVSHQFGSDGMFNDCQRYAPLPIMVVAAVCVAVCLAAAYASALVIRRAEQETTPRIVAAISVGFALLVTLAILLPMVGAIVLPPCFG